MINTITLLLTIATTAPGATGTAQRTIRSDEGLWRLAAGAAIGGLEYVLRTQRGGTLAAIREGRCEGIEIDGQPPVYWLARYAGQRSPSRVGWAFRFRMGGLHVQRQTEFSAGQVALTTDVWGSFQASRRLTHVRLYLVGCDVGGASVITATATGTTNTCLGRRIISRGLADALADAERAARGAHASGHALADAFLRRIHGRGLR